MTGRDFTLDLRGCRKKSVNSTTTRFSSLLCAAAMLSPLVYSGTAFAGDKIYWANFHEGIRVGELDGTGVPQFVGPNFAREGNLSGEVIAIDPAANKIYWVNWQQNAVRVGNLDGSGTPESLYTGEEAIQGLAIDPAAGKIYWATHPAAVKNHGVADPRGVIRVGNLDGSGTPKTLYGGELGPNGLTIDPAAGKLYWTSGTYGHSSIRMGNTDGSGKVKELYGYSNPGQVGPKPTDRIFNGEAIDIRTGKIYFTNWNGWAGKGGIMVANIDGRGEPKFLGPNYASGEGSVGTAKFDPAYGVTGTYGMAIDPDTNKLYWSNPNTGEVRVGSLDGSGTPRTLGPNFASERTPHQPTLLKAPLGTGVPEITGEPKVGSRLHCSQGSWANDLPTAHLYRAPRSFSYQWLLNGAPIDFASSRSYTPTQAGSYSCRVTASNHAGPSVQTTRATSVSTGK